MKIPFGPWRPDVSALNSKFVLDVTNVVPASTGFVPIKALEVVTEALPATCVGAGTVRSSLNSPATYAGTATKLYQLIADDWTDITRTSGGNYNVGADDRWQFETFGDTLIAVNGTDEPQALDMQTPAKFANLDGSPPVAKYIATVGDFVVLGNLITSGTPYGARVQWCGLGDATEWTVGTNWSDYQDLYTGGPVTGLASGDVGFIFQYSAIRRMIHLPGNDAVFQIERVERNRGCIAPHSIVQTGQTTYFLSQDGFYELDHGAGRAMPIDAEKVQLWWRSDVRQSTDLNVIGGLDPINHRVLWAYISKDNPTTVPDRVLIYDWSIKEWGKASMPVQAFARYVGSAYTLEGLDAVSDLDSLPYSLDSAYWMGGAAVGGIINGNGELGTLSGLPMAATIVTNDYKADGNRQTFVSSVIPEIDTTSAQVALGVAERHGDAVQWTEPSGIEATGETEQHVASRYLRARLTVDAGATWELAHGLEVVEGDDGDR